MASKVPIEPTNSETWRPCTIMFEGIVLYIRPFPLALPTPPTPHPPTSLQLIDMRPSQKEKNEHMAADLDVAIFADRGAFVHLTA